MYHGFWDNISRKRPGRTPAEESARVPEAPEAGPGLEALRTGAAVPSAEQMGRRVDLPDAMRSKMENAFGADLSAVKLYESRTVADAGAKAVARGADIAFAPGLLDFSSFGGQALLGHEISHVVSQARGEVTGGGFLNDSALEARADREGAMAAAGQTVSMPTASLSPVTAAAAEGPMQAKDKDKSKPNPWKFSSSKTDQNELPSGGIGWMLGMSNADDEQHGAEFKDMMAKLKPLAVAKGNRRHLGDMGYDAAAGNAYDAAIEGLTTYRAKLASETGRDEERSRQMALLDQYITAAAHDKEKNAALMTTTIPGSEFSGKVAGGGINQVYRFQREEAGAYFKPRQEESGDVEKSVMARVGIRPAEAATEDSPGYDPRLANREIAFSRLGNMLGSSVTVGAKKAVLGGDMPTGKRFGTKTFNAKSGDAGLVMEEAKGSSWRSFDWDYYGPDMPKRKRLDDMDDDERLQALGKMSDDPLWGGKESTDKNVGSRLARLGMRLRKKSTTSSEFEGQTNPFTPEYYGKKGKQKLDAANPAFQQQMNQMFLLDTLAAHTDRHGGNFLIDPDEDGNVNVRAIDNDLTFGALADEDADRAAFGKRDKSFNYGGLPAAMQIDAGMAKKIRGMTKQMLETSFSDLLEPREIDALWTRFQMMKDYIDKQEAEDPSLIVSEWNDDTAKRELSLAGGISSYDKEERAGPGGYSGNNYYQRHMLMLHASERGHGMLYSFAHGM